MRPFLTENPSRLFKPSEPSSEQQFEEQVLRVTHEIMPNYMAAPWKPLIKDWHGHGAKPDLAIISNDLDDWYVVEVELATHSITNHIAPQLETLRDGIYDRTLLESLQQAFPDECVDSLKRLLNREPGLLCIVDQYTQRIAQTCKTFGFDLAVFEPYYSAIGGWGVLIELLPNELERLTSPSTFVLRRGEPLGDSVVMELPRNFPASLYKIRLPSESDDQPVRFTQVKRLERGPGLVLSSSVVPEHLPVTIEVIDPANNLAELVVHR